MKTVVNKGLFGGMTRLQKARRKKFHGTIEVDLGLEVSLDGSTSRSITRHLDVYFDDVEELTRTIYDWKYSSYMDFRKKFHGTSCRNHRMEFHDHPRFLILGGGRNRNKSFEGTVTDEEEDAMFRDRSMDELITRRMRDMWNTKIVKSS